MSLSDAPGLPGTPGSSDPSESDPDGQSPRWGTVFMGPDKSRESRMDKVLNAHERELWDRGTEIAYPKRVREKAAAEAQSILDKARENGEALRQAAHKWAEDVKLRTEALHGEAMQARTEAQALKETAEHIRTVAQQEGYEAGMTAAQEEIAAHEYHRDAATSLILRRIQEQCGMLFEAWRDELAALTRDAVETAVGWVLDDKHTAILEQVLTESVQAMEVRQRVSVHVNPDEEELVRGLMTRAHERLGVARWDVRADPVVEPGGVVLESDAGRVENLPSRRRAIVEEVLARLTVPRSAADEAAEAVVNAPAAELDKLPAPELVMPIPAALGPDLVDAAIEPLDLLPDEGHDLHNQGQHVASDADQDFAPDEAAFAETSAEFGPEATTPDPALFDEESAATLAAKDMPDFTAHEALPDDAAAGVAMPDGMMPDGMMHEATEGEIDLNVSSAFAPNIPDDTLETMLPEIIPSAEASTLTDDEAADAADVAFSMVADDGGAVDAIIELEPDDMKPEGGIHA